MKIKQLVPGATIVLTFLLSYIGTLSLYHRLHLRVARVKAPTTHYHGYDLNKRAIRRMKTLTVLISAEGFGGISRGTGVLIDSRHVLTCAHVANHHNDEMRVFLYPGYISAVAKTVYQDQSKDLAILELDVSAKAPYWPTFEPNVWDGEPITIIGNALGSMKWFVAYGIISGGDKRDLYTDGLVLGGDSGGPWINEKGKIVAISDWGLGRRGEETGISGGVAAKTILQFLEDWKHPSLLQRLFGGE